MREELHALFAEAGPLALLGGASADPAAPPEAGPPPGLALAAWDAGPEKFSPEYIRDRVREDLFPLAKGCYADALKRNPKLSGRLAVSFRILGDKKVGGVVDEAHMTEDTTIDDAEMQTCVRESMMSVSFDAPPNDGEVTVVYPIDFSPDDDEAGSD
ncbi:MAG TPA: AgmX/PglI C-terminal domain-containing protein [Polyangiaceae bacterium]|nr:AgmX/PglI C-terminal domain-containing protein [Polyangiaceae bacterium]